MNYERPSIVYMTDPVIENYGNYIVSFYYSFYLLNEIIEIAKKLRI
jgi:hypothetical protein